MATVLGTLRDLHALHKELAEAQAELKRIPLQLKSREADLAKKQTALDATREAIKRAKMNVDSKEVSLKAGEAKVQDYKLKLNLCKSNKEFSALQEEIKHFQAGNSALEEEILGLMGEMEAKQAEAAAELNRLNEAKTEFAKFKEVIDYKLEKLGGRVGLLEGKIGEFESQLDSTTLADYRRLVKLKGSDALAGCHDGICEACYTGQTPQSLNELLMGRVVFCKSCGSMLYQK